MANGLSPKGSVREALQWAQGTHPLEMAHHFFPFPLYEWQRDILCAASIPHSRVIETTANESGKTSSIIPIFGLTCMCAFPGCWVYSTSGSDRQVKEQLFEQQLRPLVERKTWKSGWNIKTGSEFKVTCDNGSTWLGYVCSDAKTAEGFHGKWTTDEKTKIPRYCPCIYIVDEAKSVADEVHEAIRRIDPDFMIVLSTPGREGGWLYEGIDPDTLRAK